LKASDANLYTFIRLVLGSDVSDREFARRAGLSWRSFLSLKQGKRVSPRVAELGSIANALDLDPAMLFEAARGTPAELLHAALVDPGNLAELVLPRAHDTHEHRGSPEVRPLDGVMRLSVEHLRHGVCGLDLDGRIVAANRALGAIVGHSPTRLRRLSLWDVLATHHRTRVGNELAATYVSGTLHEVAVTLVCHDGTKVSALVDGTRIDRQDGSPVGIQLLVRRSGDTRPEAKSSAPSRARKR
jgi:PAS domain S-box-containing protein